MEGCNSEVHMKPILLAALSALALSGCVTVIEGNAVSPGTEIPSICIIHNPRVKLEYAEPAMMTALERRGIDAKVVETKEEAKACRFTIRYSLNRGWDFTPYLKKGAAYLYDGSRLLASSSLYVYPYDLSKWSDEESKVEKLIDQLFDGTGR